MKWNMSFLFQAVFKIICLSFLSFFLEHYFESPLCDSFIYRVLDSVA